MLISNFNLCKSEWLELVFAKRNKEYGAYYIRQHYADNVVKAMGITFVSVISAAVIFGILVRAKPETLFKNTEVVLTKYVEPPVPPKAELKKVKPAATKPLPPVNTTKYVQMIVTDKPVTIDPPKQIDLQKTAVGPVEIKTAGGVDGINIPSDAGKGNGMGNDDVEKSNEIHTYVDVMPEPFGGAAGWGKFLQKNLHYPPEALDKGIGGRVLVSFVVEKDGHLSSVMVDRGAGFGMDEEALRVLKLSHAWKPGMQSGQPVRVKYTIPISFSISQ
ncbi:energy transducer TonB [Mucilaginibacter sp.]|uniref:energy transducer TonB n=1 Tax=Mucilaginibacter sp. TaxID=1882438 RepID=UPI00261A799B|nr:energy transducer TonB [Mucilaginibacter sp.]MDB4925972.1 TonB family protein [Mucilaginibacter sp.]